MSEYKHIKSLGLMVETPNGIVGSKYVKASDLEKLLESGVEVFGFSGTQNGQWSAEYESCDNSTALLINIKPIEKLEPVNKKELIDLLSDYKISDIPEFRKMVDRIKKAGIKS